MITPGIYRHYKGGDCTVLGVGLHSESKEELVIYQHDGQYWVRPKDMFESTVTVDGTTMQRFTRMGST